MARYAKTMLTQASKVSTSITYTCDGEEITVKNPSYSYEGGCSCSRDGGDSYCYCPSIEIMAEIHKCPRCGNAHSFDLRY
jgi:hypothetical protein